MYVLLYNLLAAGNTKNHFQYYRGCRIRLKPPCVLPLIAPGGLSAIMCGRTSFCVERGEPAYVLSKS